MNTIYILTSVDGNIAMYDRFYNAMKALRKLDPVTRYQSQVEQWENCELVITYEIDPEDQQVISTLNYELEEE